MPGAYYRIWLGISYARGIKDRGSLLEGVQKQNNLNLFQRFNAKRGNSAFCIQILKSFRVLELEILNIKVLESPSCLFNFGQRELKVYLWVCWAEQNIVKISEDICKNLLAIYVLRLKIAIEI